MIPIGSFDFNDITHEIMKETGSNLQFVIDQQQYLQGYLPVVLITLELTTQSLLIPNILNQTSGEIEAVLTGPGFIIIYLFYYFFQFYH